jgi:hypothetical protein
MKAPDLTGALQRKGAANYCSQRGLPTTEKSLKHHADRGTGPEFWKIGPNCLYLPSALDAWIAANITHNPGFTKKLAAAAPKPAKRASKKLEAAANAQSAS